MEDKDEKYNPRANCADILKTLDNLEDAVRKLGAKKCHRCKKWFVPNNIIKGDLCGLCVAEGPKKVKVIMINPVGLGKPMVYGIKDKKAALDYIEEFFDAEGVKDYWEIKIDWMDEKEFKNLPEHEGW